MTMTKSIVIIGDSSLSVLVGRRLDGDLARQAHIEVIHLTRDKSLIYSPQIVSLLGGQNFPSKSHLYRHVQCRKSIIKQINLNDHRIITASETINYDVLFLDLTPSHTALEIAKISQQVTRLVTEIQAKINLGRQLRTRVTFEGEDVLSWQLALSLADDIMSLPTAIQRSLIIQAPFPQDTGLKDFLITNGVGSVKSLAPLPGITIMAASPPVKNRFVRGAMLDDKDNFILRATLNPEGHPELIVVDRHRRLRQNILRVDQTIAVQIAANIERFLSGERQLPINYPRPTGILRGQTSDYVWIGNFQRSHLWAKLVSMLDRRFYRQIIEGIRN